MRCDCASVKGCWMWADALNFSSVLFVFDFPFLSHSSEPFEHS